MRFIIFLGILALIDLLSFFALRVVAQNMLPRWKTALYMLHWSVPVLAIVLFLLWLYTDVPQRYSTAFTLIRALVVIAYISKFVIAVFVLFDDLRRLVLSVHNYITTDPPYDAGRSKFISTAGIVAGALPFALLSYGMLRNPYRYQLHEVIVPISGLPEELDGFRIVQISDIHAGSFTFKEPLYNAIDMINSQQPDVAVFTGDLVNNRADEMLPYIEVFSKVKAKHGVYSIMGNHDYGDYVRWPSREAKSDNMKLFQSIHKQMGWKLLLDEHDMLKVGEAKLAILGVGNIAARANFPTYGDLSKAYSGCENADVKILLSHDPSSWDKFVRPQYSDITLTLSGHTHGFQFGIEIPGFFRFSPSQFVYRQWAGLYGEDDQFLYVNRGLGFLGYPGRVGILPEVTSIVLRRA